MPREASRINLKVKRVWVERIQDITYADMLTEGTLDWESNPWVWCCEFEVVK
jgi:hypothetical protein